MTDKYDLNWTCHICGKHLFTDESALNISSVVWGNVQRHFCTEHVKFCNIQDEMYISDKMYESLSDIVCYNSWLSELLYHFYIILNSQYSGVRANWHIE